LATHEEFSTAKSKKKKYLRDLSKETRKSGHHRHFNRESQVIILDEPFANLDPTTQFRLKKSSRI
jgi:ABC-2 type transport system ATP-binding protein